MGLARDYWLGALCFLVKKRFNNMKKIILPIVLGFILIPSLSFASIDKNLSYGSRGPQVTELQEFLIDKGFLQGTSTGNFYSLTLKAVKSFQLTNNIPNTGYVGVLTRTEINNKLNAETASSTAEQISETGTTNPVATTSAVLTQLQQQNQLLQQQLSQLQTQTQQVQSIQNSLNQVVQNTTPTPVVIPTPIVTLDKFFYTYSYGSNNNTDINQLRINSTVPINTGSLIITDGTSTVTSVSMGSLNGRANNNSCQYFGMGAFEGCGDAGTLYWYVFNLNQPVSNEGAKIAFITIDGRSQDQQDHQ